MSGEGTDESGADTISLVDVVRLAWRERWLVLATTLIVAGAESSAMVIEGPVLPFDSSNVITIHLPFRKHLA